MLALTPTHAILHAERMKRQRRFAVSARNAESVRLQREKDEAMAREAALRPSESERAWLKMQRQMFAATGEPVPVQIDQIQKVVAHRFGLSRSDLISDRRTHDVTGPRQVAMYLAKKLTPRSLAKIGRRFGDRDHATVLHAVRRVEALIAADATIAATVDALTAALS